MKYCIEVYGPVAFVGYDKLLITALEMVDVILKV